MNEAEAKSLEKDAGFLAEQSAAKEMEMTPTANPKKSSSAALVKGVESTKKELVQIEFKNAPEGMKATGNASGLSMPGLSSTRN